MKPKCDKMVMKHEKWTSTLMPQSRINVPDVKLLTGFIILNMTVNIVTEQLTKYNINISFTGLLKIHFTSGYSSLGF